MGGLTLEDFSQSRAYQEIFGSGEAREAAKVALRQLNRHCRPLSLATSARIQALPLEKLACSQRLKLRPVDRPQLSSDIRNWSSGDTKTGPPCEAVAPAC